MFSPLRKDLIPARAFVSVDIDIAFRDSESYSLKFRRPRWQSFATVDKSDSALLVFMKAVSANSKKRRSAVSWLLWTFLIALFLFFFMWSGDYGGSLAEWQPKEIPKALFIVNRHGIVKMAPK